MDDMGGDDAGGGSEVMDPSLMEGDDMMVGEGMGGMGPGTAAKALDLKVQTMLALQELGIVIGVAFMVATIFFIMIFVEKVCDSVNDIYQKKFHPEDQEDPEAVDPASLVGTFKRYKN